MAKLEVELNNISRVLRSRASETIGRVSGESEKMLKKVKEKGERTQQEGRRQLEKVVTQVKKSDVFALATDAYEEVEKLVEDNIVKILHFLQIPTRDEMKSLNQKVKKLGDQVDSLQKAPKRARTKKTTAKKTTPRRATTKSRGTGRSSSGVGRPKKMAASTPSSTKVVS